MEHLDDFIREQFQQDDPAARFPYQEEYWEQALPLIEAAERKRRRRGLLWWWPIGLLLLSGGWYGWHSRQPPPAANTAVDGPSSTVISPVGAPSSLSKNTATWPREPANRPAIQVQPVDYLNTKNSNTTSETGNTPKTGRKNGNKEAYWATKGQRSAMLYPETNNLDVVQPDMTPTLATTIAAVPENATTEARPGVLLAHKTERMPADSNTGIQPWQQLRSLPTPSRILSFGPGKFSLAQVPFVFPRLKIVHETTFAWGINASAGNYLLAAPTGKKWGATLGTYAEYWLRPAWSISAGLQYRNQPIDLSQDTQTTVHQLHYRFGYEEEIFHQADRNLYFVEVPLALHGHYRSWQIETGVNLGRLVGVRSVRIQTSRSSLIPTPEETEKRIRANLTTYRRNYTALFAGLGWQPLHRLQLEVRATYRLGSLLAFESEYPLPSGNWWLDAGLRWQLFSDDRIRVKR